MTSSATQREFSDALAAVNRELNQLPSFQQALASRNAELDKQYAEWRAGARPTVSNAKPR
jgi:hypothetical protein